jgi:hypothetical protein
MKAKPKKKTFKRKKKQLKTKLPTDESPFEQPALPAAEVVEKKKKKKKAKAERHKEKTLTEVLLKPATKAERISKADLIGTRVDLYQLEWAVKYQHLTPHEYLRNIKGFTEGQYIEMMKLSPSKHWEDRRSDLKSQMSTTLIRRHIDQLAEMNDKHATVGKIGIAEGLKLLTKGVLVKKPGKKSKSGKVQLTEYTRPLYPREFKEIMDGMKTAQSIYRTAMGLPNDHQGLTQVLEKLASESRQIQHNLQINIGGAPAEKKEDPVEVTPEQQLKNKLNELSYDEVMVFITRKRQKLAEAEGEEIKDVQPSNG